MNTPAERLRLAREHRFYRTAADFARTLDIVEATYRSYENGTRAITLSVAQRLADALDVPWTWILTGEGAPDFIIDMPDGTKKLVELKAIHGAADRSGKKTTTELTQASVVLPEKGDMPLDVPVRGTAAGSVTGAFQLEEAIVDRVRRPPGLFGAADVYALYVEGASMEPKHERGDLVFVHPHRPIRIGDSVVVQIKNGEHDPVVAYIKRLVRRTADQLIVEQLNPQKTMKFPMSEVKAVHKVMTVNDLFGI